MIPASGREQFAWQYQDAGHISEQLFIERTPIIGWRQKSGVGDANPQWWIPLVIDDIRAIPLPAFLEQLQELHGENLIKTWIENRP